MNKFLILAIATFTLNISPAFADSHGYDQKTVLENERVRIVLATIKPGGESPSVTRELDRIVYAVKGGAIQRKYEDGTTALVSYKTGDVVFSDKPEDKQKYAVKNIGKSTVILQVTFLK
jgi:hypothetical protein